MLHFHKVYDIFLIEIKCICKKNEANKQAKKAKPVNEEQRLELNENAMRRHLYTDRQTVT